MYIRAPSTTYGIMKKMVCSVGYGIIQYILGIHLNQNTCSTHQKYVNNMISFIRLILSIKLKLTGTINLDNNIPNTQWAVICLTIIRVLQTRTCTRHR